MHKRLLLLVACISLLGIAVFMPTNSDAVMMSGGNIESSSSWTWLTPGWQDASGLGFDQLETFIMGSTDPFHEDGQFNYDVSGWSATLINPKYSNATGPAIGAGGLLLWDERHEGTLSDGMWVVEDMMAWKNGILVEAGQLAFQIGWFGYWDLYNETWTAYSLGTFNPYANEYNRAPVPVPATMLLFGSGLMALAGIRRKFRMK